MIKEYLIIGIMAILLMTSVTAFNRYEAAEITNQQLRNNIQNNIIETAREFYPEGVEFFFSINYLEQYSNNYFLIQNIEVSTFIQRNHINNCRAIYNNCFERLVNGISPINYIDENNNSLTVEPIMYQLRDIAKTLYKRSKATRNEAQLSLMDFQGDIIINVELED